MGWLCSLLLCCALRVAAQTPLPPQEQLLLQRQQEGLGVENSLGTTLVVYIHQANGRPLSNLAAVKLSSNLIVTRLMRGVFETRNAVFGGLLPGEYVVEVTADGFWPTRQEVTIFRDGQSRCFVLLRPQTEAEREAQPPPIPMLPAKQRKELDAGIAALKAHQPAEAWKHVNYMLKHAPGNPDVQYVAALYYLMQKDERTALLHLDSVVKGFPDYDLAQVALGELLLRQKKADEAIPHLEKAVTRAPDSWRGHWLLAEALLRANREIPAAKFHAGRALAVGKENAAAAKGTLARAEALLHPPDLESEGAAGGEPAPDLPSDAPEVKDALSRELPVGALLADLLSRWPKDIDAAVPAADADTGCSLPQVLEGTARRATEFSDSLERFSATESIEQEELDVAGASRKMAQHSFDYSAMLDRYSPEAFSIVEMRNGSYSSPQGLPVPLAARGLPAISVLFNSNYARDFRFTCEGLGNHHGQPAWQVRFEQREDRPSRIYQWVIEKHAYPAPLKGRAWISTGSFHILRMETDLVKPIEKIRLDTHHMAVDYAPVNSKSGKLELWLPLSAEVHSHYRGRFVRERHEFRNFTLFSVDSIEKIAAPAAKR